MTRSELPSGKRERFWHVFVVCHSCSEQTTNTGIAYLVSSLYFGTPM